MGESKRTLPAEIECIFYDFDGVMTDNRVLVDQDGKESVFINRSDGYAIARFREMGILQIIVSTEKNPVVVRRAEKLKIPVIHGVNDKGTVIKEYCREYGYNLSNTVFIGNDLNDLSAFDVTAFRGSPSDAEYEVMKIADWISHYNGGYGVIRDFYRFVSEEYGYGK